MTSPLFSPTFIIGSIRIGSVEGASCVNMGNNYPTNFQNYKKHNQGFGNVGGDNNQITGTRAFLDDSDMVDRLGGGPEPEVPEWVQELIVASQENARS